MKYLLTLCLSIIPFCSHADTGFYPVEPSFFPSFETCCEPFANTFSGPSSLQIHGGYAFGDFIGLKKGYGEIGAFWTPETRNGYQPVVDLNIYHLHDGHFASSIGAGVRWRGDCDRIWGANLFYDYRKGHIGNFNRIGIGAELLNAEFWNLCLDYRLNFYLPFDSEHKGEGFSKQGIPYKEKNFIYTGLDFEVGKQFWQQERLSFYGAIGPYLYHPKSDKNVYGLQGRLVVNWTRYFAFEARCSFDNVFKSNLQGKIIFTIPLNFCCLGCGDDVAMTQPIYRNGIIFEKNETKWPKIK